ncbi:hypothetical protein [Spongiimicrobium salis]|uniref:hypothetical protein n=1 Tax=Spongiimicrobium salis TaxID=1667022 RepID=UPI00374D0651
MKKDEINMDAMLYLAAQYLAQAGNSFLEPRPDGSQATITFCKQNNCLQTQPLTAAGDRFCLNYDFSLQWKKEHIKNKPFFLHGKTHKEVLQWIKNSAEQLRLGKPYQYLQNKEFPYGPMTNDFQFLLLDKARLAMLAQYRKAVREILDEIMEKYQINMEVAIWPQDFNTSAFALLNSKTDITLSFGMTTPKPHIKNSSHHLFMTAWHGLENVSTHNFPALSVGKWSSEENKGAVVSLQEVNKQEMINFFEETIYIYKNQFYLDVG